MFPLESTRTFDPMLPSTGLSSRRFHLLLLNTYSGEHVLQIFSCVLFPDDGFEGVDGELFVCSTCLVFGSQYFPSPLSSSPTHIISFFIISFQFPKLKTIVWESSCGDFLFCPFHPEPTDPTQQMTLIPLKSIQMPLTHIPADYSSNPPIISSLSLRYSSHTRITSIQSPHERIQGQAMAVLRPRESPEASNRRRSGSSISARHRSGSLGQNSTLANVTVGEEYAFWVQQVVDWYHTGTHVRNTARFVNISLYSPPPFHFVESLSVS
jgi:hypothetical protein